jgi:RNA-binding protein YhbY
VRREIEAALDAHGLVKVRVFSDDRCSPRSALAELSEAFGAAPIQHIGKLLVLWRPPAPKEKAEKEGRMPGPKVVKVLKFSKSGNHRPQVKKVTVVGNMRLAAGARSSARRGGARRASRSRPSSRSGVGRGARGAPSAATRGGDGSELDEEERRRDAVQHGERRTALAAPADSIIGWIA